MDLEFELYKDLIERRPELLEKAIEDRGTIFESGYHGGWALCQCMTCRLEREFMGKDERNDKENK